MTRAVLGTRRRGGERGGRREDRDGSASARRRPRADAADAVCRDDSALSTRPRYLDASYSERSWSEPMMSSLSMSSPMSSRYDDPSGLSGEGGMSVASYDGDGSMCIDPALSVSEPVRPSREERRRSRLARSGVAPTAPVPPVAARGASPRPRGARESRRAPSTDSEPAAATNPPAAPDTATASPGSPGREGDRTADRREGEGDDATEARDGEEAREGEGAARAGAGPAGGGRGGGTGGPGLGGSEETAEAESAFPNDLIAAEELPPTSAPLALQPLSPQWAAPNELAADALVLPKPSKRDSPAEAEQARRDESGARDRAQRAYSDLVGNARREQAAFVGRANDIGAAIARAYDRAAAELLQGHSQDQDTVRATTDRACLTIEGAAAFAQLQLDNASRNAGIAIESAGRRAYGMIATGERTASASIGAVVTGLVAGHIGAYNGVIGEARAAFDEAMLALNTWRDDRTTLYPIDDADALEGAKNESRQSRIPRWSDSEASRMQGRFDEKRKAWEKSRDTTACSTSCSYRAAMETEHARLVTEGRGTVAGALTRARGSLHEQSRDGRKALNALRDSRLAQARVQGRATASRLTSQVRAAIAGARNEAQGAMAGVRGAAAGSLPSYERGALGFEQSLRKAAPGGAKALRQTAERGVDGVLGGMRRANAQLDERLQGNLDRAHAGLDTRVSEHRQSCSYQLLQFDAALFEQGSEASAQLDASAGGFVEAFGGLAQTVAQAAPSWALPLDTRMAAFIGQKRGEAAAALATLLTGEPPAAGGGGGGAAAGAGGGGEGGEGEAAAPAPDCSHCESEAGGSTQDGGGGESSGGGEAGPQGLSDQADDEIDHYNERAEPDTFFSAELTETGDKVNQNLAKRSTDIAARFEGAFAGTVDEEGAIAVLRGLTAAKGLALDTVVYPRDVGSSSLDADLYEYLNDDPDDLAAARAYLRGDAVEGARLELNASRGVFNDDEARIEATMRALSPDQLATLGRDHAGTMADVRDVLDGTDLQVFDALAEGDYALADAHRMHDAVDEARRDGNADAVHTAIEQYTGAPAEGDWRATEEMSADDRRTAVVAALGGIVTDEEVAGGAAEGADVSRLTAQERAVAFVSRIDRYEYDDRAYGDGMHGGGGGRVVTRRMEGANRDLSEALLLHGESSVEARAARLGVEIQRTGEAPNAINIDRATFDERFSGDLANATPEERAAHARAAADRARVVMLAAERYAGGEAAPEGYVPGAANADAGTPDNPADDATAAMSDTRVTAARDRLIQQLQTRFGSDTTGAELAAGLLTDARPTPETAARAMRHAMYSRTGTNEELIFRFTERMNRDEIAAMRTAFSDQTGGLSLDAELGVYGEGSTFTELSGDDRLRMERAMLGVARNDTERLEVAAFAIQQQRRETGSFGAWLAEGTLADRVMNRTESRLEMLAGGPIALSRRGELMASLPNFDSDGRYNGPNRDAFVATTHIAQSVAENYSRRIDAFADVATTGIAILGAIAAAVITVATGGAAGPLIAAAVIAGLASMSANYAIKGGRYGWEQAAVDLGMTAVQAITAGVGAQLGAAAQVASKGAQAAAQASRTIATLSRIFTNNPILNQVIVGAITGSVSGLGMAALNEQTWEGRDPVGSLFEGLLKGALSGAATAALTNSIEAIGRQGATIGDRLQQLSTQRGGMAAITAMLARGGARSVISGLGGMAGRGAELAVDSATHRYRGDFGDALVSMGEAGLQAAVQGLGEGAGEAYGQSVHGRARARAGEAINRERAELGLEPLPRGEALDAAADDLMLMNRHGRHGSDGLGRALNLEHIAIHGGMAASVAVRNPDPVVEDGMRAELMRHIPPDRQAEFADVPMRVLPESEYLALTRSESGPVVTVIENGQPIVIVREGTPLARLSDEGPHLLQARDAPTRERVARLDEATLARWDSLDLDTQIDLYRTKIELEIDAHEQIQRSLAREEPSGEQAVARHEAEVERNETTLRNLRERHDELGDLTPERRAAIASGDERRPQYLDQPARLFSKDTRRTAPATEPAAADSPEARAMSDAEYSAFLQRPEVVRAGEVLREFFEAARLPSGSRSRVEEGYQDMPDAPNRALEVRERAADRSTRPRSFDSDARERARAAFGEALHDALFGAPGTRMTDASRERLDIEQLIHVMETGELPQGVEFHHLLPVADYPEFAHLAETGLALTRATHLEAGHNMQTRRPIEAATLLDPGAETRPIGLHNDPEAVKGYRRKQAEIADGTRSTGDVDADIVADYRQRVVQAETNLRFAEQRARRPNARPADQEAVVHARTALERAQAQEVLITQRFELMRHVPHEQRALFADVPIRVMGTAEYDAMTRSRTGPAVTVIENGRPVVILREGTPPARLADEGPHLMQARETGTRERVLRLDEATMRRWDELDLDTQLDLYRTKIELEIDAHERIQRSLDADRSNSESVRNERRRNAETLDNLRARLHEVGTLGPERRDAIRSGREDRPDYLDQPARLFSKGRGPDAAGEGSGATTRPIDSKADPDAASGEPAPARKWAIRDRETPVATVDEDGQPVTPPRRMPREGRRGDDGDGETSRYKPSDLGLPSEIQSAARALIEAQALIKALPDRIEENAIKQARLSAEIERLRTRAAAEAESARATAPGERPAARTPREPPGRSQLEIREERLVNLRRAETELRNELRRQQDIERDSIDALLPELARQLDLPPHALAAAIRRFEEQSGRRYEAKHLIDSLRDRSRKRPVFGDLEGLAMQEIIEQNAIAVHGIRDHLIESRPDAVLAVQRGGAFLAEVVAGASNRPGFPDVETVEKQRTPRPGKEDDVQRTPLLKEAIRRRIDDGQDHFAIVDFYMGGHFAEELATMFGELQRSYPGRKLRFEAIWMRESHGYEVLVRGDEALTRAHLEQGVASSDFSLGVVRRLAPGESPEAIRGPLRTLANRRPGDQAPPDRIVLRLGKELITMSPPKGAEASPAEVRVTDFPVAVVLGDDMRTVFDPRSTEPIEVFDRNGRRVAIIPTGTIDPTTGAVLNTTRDIVIRLMQDREQRLIEAMRRASDRSPGGESP